MQRPVYETVTDEGNIVRVEGPEVPTKETLKKTDLPSNEKIQTELSKAKDTLKEGASEGHLDSQGKKLEKDLEEIIDSTSQLLSEKNKDEKLQQLLRESKEGLVSGVGSAQGLKQDIQQKMKETQPQVQNLQQDARELYNYIREMAWEFIRSPDFRMLLADWIQFVQSLSIRKVKEQALKQEGESVVGQAVAEGLTEPPQPLPKDELMEKTQAKLQELLTRVSSTAEYRDMVHNLFKLWDRLRGYMDSLKNKMPMYDEHFRRALEDTFDFLGEFTGKEDLVKFRTMGWNTYNSIVDDAEVNLWFYDLRGFIESSIDRPESLTEEDRKNKIKELSERGRYLFEKEKWRLQFDELNDQFQLLLDNIKNDSTTQNFASKFEKFARDLLFNEQGMPDLFVLEDSLSQLKNLVVPLFKNMLENIPINRVEVVTDTWDVRVEDIIFDATTFLPEHLDFRLANTSHVDFKDEKKDITRHQMLLQVDHIKPQFKHLKFFYRRKSFPTISDFGVADLAIAGEGAAIRVVWTIESKGNLPPVAQLSEATVAIDKLSIHIVGEATKHELLDTILAPIFSSMIKNKIASTLEEYLKKRLLEINARMNNWFVSRPTFQLQQKADQAIKEAYQRSQPQSILHAK